MEKYFIHCETETGGNARIIEIGSTGTCDQRQWWQLSPYAGVWMPLKSRNPGASVEEYSYSNDLSQPTNFWEKFTQLRVSVARQDARMRDYPQIDKIIKDFVEGSDDGYLATDEADAELAGLVAAALPPITYRESSESEDCKEV